MFKKMLSSAVAALGFALSAAHAGTISVSLTQDLNPDVQVLQIQSRTLTFDLNSLLTLQNAIAANISSAVFNFELNDPVRGNETLLFTLGQGDYVQTYTVSGNNHVPNGNSNTSFIVSLTNALTDLKTDGIIRAVLSASSGEYYLDKATLTANVLVADQGGDSNNAPEPGTVAIFGLGLMGLAFSRRKSH